MGLAIIKYFTKEEDAEAYKQEYSKKENIGLERLIIIEENGEFSVNLD